MDIKRVTRFDKGVKTLQSKQKGNSFMIHTKNPRI